ncbi:MAG TPA: T9SS type A sorting domain-containing protein [Bacteroidota bacterium]|nr:T9SS type A sorting domain-containing protein [Bacteroidota bacterium]
MVGRRALLNKDYSISAFPSGDVWCGGYNGRIFKKNGTSTAVQGDGETPRAFQLYQNYPNPFNPSTTIGFDVAQNTFTTLKVYNLLGQEVATLVNEQMKPGTYEVKWNASLQSSGLYFYQLRTDGLTESKRMLFLK